MIPVKTTKDNVETLIALGERGYTVRSGSRMSKRGGEPIPEWQLFDPLGLFVRRVARKPVADLFNAGHADAIHSYACGTLKGWHR